MVLLLQLRSDDDDDEEEEEEGGPDEMPLSAEPNSIDDEPDIFKSFLSVKFKFMAGK